MEKELSKSIDELVNYIKDTKEYNNCIKLKKEIKNDKELINLIENTKKLQKEYIKTNNMDIKKELDNNNDLLESNPLFVLYNQNLDKVNYMINYVKDDLNKYFYDLLNK